METKQQVPKISSYQNKPIIILNPDDKYPFQFGISKARLIINNIDAIKSFYERYAENQKNVESQKLSNNI